MDRPWTDGHLRVALLFMMADVKRLRKRQDAHLKVPSHLHLYLRKADDALLYSRRHQLAGLQEGQISKDRRSHMEVWC
jgi:UTP:GlnB (protein PII) uridylyltransferase